MGFHRAGSFLEVGTGAERRTFVGDHHRTNRRIRIGRSDGPKEPVEQGRSQGIAIFYVHQGGCHDAAVGGHSYGFHQSSDSLAPLKFGRSLFHESLDAFEGVFAPEVYGLGPPFGVESLGKTHGQGIREHALGHLQG